MARILLAGFGKLAAALVDSMSESSHQFYGIARRPIQHPRVTGIQWDLRTPHQQQLNECEGIDYVVVTMSPDAISDEDYRLSYAVAVDHLLNALKAFQPPPQIIYVSSTRVFAQNDGEWINEASPTAANSQQTSYLLHAETAVRVHRHDNIIVRSAGIYGGTRQYFKKKVAAGIKVQKRPAQYSNRIHQDDLVGILAFIIEQRERGQLVDPLLLACDDDPAPLLDVARHIADTFDYPAPLEIINDGDLAPKGKRCRNDKIKSLGYRFRYPSYREGYQP
ncbi:MAG: sugar nucleotide-binding protein [Gammaproteobacteria bacterium]|nr:sugar nucleotide-binding protein [Gammaproteobacteria bacterium]